VYSPPPQQSYQVQQKNLRFAAQPLAQPQQNYVIAQQHCVPPQQNFVLPRTLSPCPPQLQPLISNPQPQTPAQLAKPELLADTLAIAKQPAELQDNLAMQDQQQAVQPARCLAQHEAQQSVQDQLVQHETQQAAQNLIPGRSSAPRLLTQPEYSAPVELDQAHETQENTARQGPWQFRRIRRNNSTSTLETPTPNQAPLKWKIPKTLTKSAELSKKEQIPEPKAPKKAEIHDTKKRRLFKPRREKDEDYDEDEGEEEGADDDDEEYHEVPLRRRRSSSKRKQ
jgi:hypothetical protein